MKNTRLKFPTLKTKRVFQETKTGQMSQKLADVLVGLRYGSSLYFKSSVPHAQWRTVKYSRRFSRRGYASHILRASSNTAAFFGSLLLCSNDVTKKLRLETFLENNNFFLSLKIFFKKQIENSNEIKGKI